MGKINSRQKGAVAEREIAKILRGYGYEARRGQQYNGFNGDADIVTNIVGFHWEIKRTERVDIDKFMEQSIRDAKDGETPIVAHRRNNKEWKVTMRLDDFIKLYKATEGD